VRMFNEAELQMLISGSEEGIDVDDLMQHISYAGTRTHHPRPWASVLHCCALPAVAQSCMMYTALDQHCMCTVCARDTRQRVVRGPQAGSRCCVVLVTVLMRTLFHRPCPCCPAAV
jgi:hypothetical protein